MKFGTRTVRGRVVYDRKHHPFRISDLERILKSVLTEYGYADIPEEDFIRLLRCMWEIGRTLIAVHQVYLREWDYSHRTDILVASWLTLWAGQASGGEQLLPPRSVLAPGTAFELVLPDFL